MNGEGMIGENNEQIRSPSAMMAMVRIRVRVKG